MTCPSCGVARPGPDFACLACGAAADAPARSQVHLELALGESDDIVLTTTVLERLVGGDSALVRRACERAQVHLVAQLSQAERERLFSLLANMGTRFRESKTFMDPEGSSLQLSVDRGLLARSLLLVCVAIALLSLGWTLLSCLALPVAAVTVWGKLERVPDALAIPTRAVDAPPDSSRPPARTPAIAHLPRRRGAPRHRPPATRTHAPPPGTRHSGESPTRAQNR